MTTAPVTTGYARAGKLSTLGLGLARCGTRHGGLLKAIAVLLLTAVCGPLGCSKSDCDGVVVDGECQRQCLDSLCQDGQRCVDNVCTLSCKSDADCDDGRCKRLISDYGARGKYCVFHEPEPEPSSEEESQAPTDSETTDPPLADECSTNAECADPFVQKNCISGHCVPTCLLHEHCAGVGACTGDALDADGLRVSYCEAEPFEHALGQYGSACVNGVTDCDQSSGFVCVTSGEGDVEAYCSKLGCEDDSACPVGYYCNQDASRVFPCESACGIVGDPTDPECIPASEIGPDGNYRCSALGLELRSCRKREFCAACTSDADCRGTANQICAKDGSGQKVCTLLCDPTGPSCPWGSASACAVHDPDLGLATCGHRYGSCTGQGNGCEPCVDDGDCPRGFCSISDFTGERFCVDLEATCGCPLGADTCFGGGCPLTPGGLDMACVPTQANAAPSACFGSTVVPGDETATLGCWPL